MRSSSVRQIWSCSSFDNNLSKLKAHPTEAVLLLTVQTYFPSCLFIFRQSHYITLAGLELYVDKAGL